jgi:UDPglucose 6-dehydrogenase
MQVGIIGTGYVGIVTGSCLSEMGHLVTCFDVDQKKIDIYSSGKSAIYEPGLEEILQKNIAAKRLSFTTNIENLIENSELIFLCVGTPPLSDGSADLSQVESAVRNIAEHTPAGSYKIIVEKSTVPVGTHKRLKTITKLYNKGKSKFDFVVNSEFLKEGSAVYDFLNPDRIVIGLETQKAREKMMELYQNFETQKVLVDPSSAEIIKYASNSFLALKISFINMVADLCEKAGGDIEKVADGIGFDKRIGRAFLNAGVGYGGSCFPKDVKAFINVLDESSVDSSMLKSTDQFNANRYKKIIETLEEELWILKNKDIAVWGLAFKAETDDIRESPSIKIVSDLLAKQVNIRLYDPKARENFEALFPAGKQISYFNNPMDALKNTEALIILTDWKEFSEIQPEKIYNQMKLPVIVDGRNIFKESTMKELGFRYFPIGKGEMLEYMRNSK